MTVPATSTSPDARRIWRAARAPVLIGALVMAVSIAIVLLGGSTEHGSLDPDSFEPDGSRALARLLQAQGVRVQQAHTVGEVDTLAPEATLLVTQPDRLSPDQLGALHHRATNLVLIAPHRRAIAAVLPEAQVTGEVSVTDRAPRCSLPAASAAGTAAAGGVLYRAGRDLARCYPDGESAALIEGAGITVLGTAAPLTNARIGEVGNAALAMRLLGRHQRLVWYLPAPDDPALRTGQRSLVELLPAGWRFGVVQTAIAVALLALWRARRLGPVVFEPLPVVVRAAETVEGRARLYRRVGAAGHAATGLRQAVRERLVPRLGLATDADPAAVVDAVADRVARPRSEIDSLLYGPPPTDDAALVRLADALDTLEDQVNAT